MFMQGSGTKRLSRRVLLQGLGIGCRISHG